MAKKIIGLNNGKVAIEFVMDLDSAFPADKWILDAVQAGMSYEPDIGWLLMRALHPGDFAIDVGANVGFFTLMMAKLVGPEGKVLAVEPGPDNMKKLGSNLGLNNLVVTFEPRPLSDCEKTVNFYLSQDDSGGHALWPPERWPENVRTKNANFPAVLGPATTLDALASDAREIRLIKLDVEGAETKVLEGAAKVLDWITPPFVIAELNWFGMEQMGTSQEELRALMEGYGYSTWLLRRDDGIPSLVPKKSLLKMPYIVNILFATEDAVAEAWPEVLL